MTMQADELKAIRLSLSMTQQQFGDAIGLSRVRVNLMESGAKPISPRTEKMVNAYLSSGAADRTIVNAALAAMIDRISHELDDPATTHVSMDRDEAALTLGLLKGLASIQTA